MWIRSDTVGGGVHSVLFIVQGTFDLVHNISEAATCSKIWGNTSLWKGFEAYLMVRVVGYFVSEIEKWIC